MLETQNCGAAASMHRVYRWHFGDRRADVNFQALDLMISYTSPPLQSRFDVSLPTWVIYRADWHFFSIFVVERSILFLN